MLEMAPGVYVELIHISDVIRYVLERRELVCALGYRAPVTTLTSSSVYVRLNTVKIFCTMADAVEDF
jgi:exo-beta-1,3-glucanase (GH17 family)